MDSLPDELWGSPTIGRGLQTITNRQTNKISSENDMKKIKVNESEVR